MKCSHCEVACATLECSECRITGEGNEENCQLCEDCSTMIHKGKMQHTVIVKPIKKEELYKGKKEAMRSKLHKLAKETSGLQRRKIEMSNLRSDLQNHLHSTELDLRKIVSDLQNKVKERCRSLYVNIKEEINQKCIELTDHETLLEQRCKDIEQLKLEMEKTILDLDEDDFLSTIGEMEDKIASMHLTKLDKPLPDFSMKHVVEAGDAESHINNICIKEIDVDGGSFIDPIQVSEGMTMLCRASGRMSKDGTFLVQPSDIDDNKLEHAISIISSSIKRDYIEDMEWETFHDSGTAPSVGERVLAFDSEYHVWCRAKVEEAKSDGWNILFTDYGHIQTLSSDRILPKRPTLYDTLPSQTVECTILGYPAPDVPNTARWQFSDLLGHTHENPCSCTFLSKVTEEGSNREVWQVDISTESEGSTTNVNDVITAKIAECGPGKGAISCRDVRLMDNPEVYSKLTTVTIERPSAEKKAVEEASEDDTASEPPAACPVDRVHGQDEGTPLSEDKTENGAISTLGVGQVSNLENEPNTDVIPETYPPYTEDAHKMSDRFTEVIPIMRPPYPEDMTDACPPYSEVCAEPEVSGLVADNGVEMNGGDCLLDHVQRPCTDSPGIEDYQSAASSMEEGASGSITPVSASSHISNLPHTSVPGDQPTDSILTQSELLTSCEPATGPISAELIDMPLEEKDKRKKKKKKRRESERSQDARSGEDEIKVVEQDQASTQPPPPVIKDMDFQLTTWLQNMGIEDPAHSRLRKNLMNPQLSALLPDVWDPRAGDIVTAKDDRDMWQRAVILEVISPKRAEVQFVDINQKKIVPIDGKLKSLFPKMWAVHPAIRLPEEAIDVLIGRHGAEQGFDPTCLDTLLQPMPEIVTEELQTEGAQACVTEELCESREEANCLPEDTPPREPRRGHNSPHGQPPRYSHTNHPNQDAVNGRGVCWNCGGAGHMRPDCPEPHDPNSPYKPNMVGSRRGSHQRGDQRDFYRENRDNKYGREYKKGKNQRKGKPRNDNGPWRGGRNQDVGEATPPSRTNNAPPTQEPW